MQHRRGGATGNTFILGGKIAGLHGPIMLPVHPLPNTRIAVPDGVVPHAQQAVPHR